MHIFNEDLQIFFWKIQPAILTINMLSLGSSYLLQFNKYYQLQMGGE